MYPDLDEVKRIASATDCGNVPVAIEVYSDMTTPIRVIQILKSHSHHCYLLESVDSTLQWGRYSFLGFDPKMEITCLNGKTVVKEGGKVVFDEMADPRPIINKVLSENRSPKIEGMPHFTGGLVGYFAYDYLKYAEPSLNLNAEDDGFFKDVDLMLFDKVIAFDNQRQKIVLIANVRTDDIEANYARAQAELAEIANMIIYEAPIAPPAGRMLEPLTPFFTEEQYCEMVEAAKRYIREGEIFQVVLSNRLSAPYEGSLFNTYRRLRTTNPSPYMFYFCSDDVEIAGSSPETLVSLKDGVLHTFPLAGTRPRGGSPDEDDALATELLADEKELAEHNMLVDLGRNDIGKVSEFGSVEVENYRDVLKFSHVMHIGSVVAGRLREGLTALDAVDAILPAGTLSGAPKIRAAQIINELENNKRGIYGGAIGFLSFTGDMDICISIRLAYLKDGQVFVRSGAGIVADSVPPTEFQECINKAKAMTCALQESENDRWL